MKRRISALVVTENPLPMVIMTIVAFFTIGGCREKGTDSSQQKEDVFLGRLDPKIQQAVQRIKQKNTIPIDDTTRHKIDNLTKELGQQHEYVDGPGGKVPLATKASWDLRHIGKAVIPQLIDAAATHQNPSVRQRALGIFFILASDKDDNLIEYLPLFVRSMSDKDARVRGVAAGQVGNMAIHFRSHNDEEKVQQCIPYLIQALKDESEYVRARAGHPLFRLGRKDLVPQELIDKYEMEGWR